MSDQALPPSRKCDRCGRRVLCPRKGGGIVRLQLDPQGSPRGAYLIRVAEDGEWRARLVGLLDAPDGEAFALHVCQPADIAALEEARSKPRGPTRSSQHWRRHLGGR